MCTLKGAMLSKIELIGLRSLISLVNFCVRNIFSGILSKNKGVS